MKSVLISLSLLLLIISSANAQKYYTSDWNSLKNYEVPEWYYDAKFGIWPIWGVYSVPEYRGDHAAEFYPRYMYLVKDSTHEFDERGEAIMEHHLKTYGTPDKFGYHDFIPMFKAEKWNPDEWAQFGVDCGAKFFTVLAEFCDGFAMYNSSYTKFNSYDMGPQRDVVAELQDAVKAKNMKFGVSCHLSWMPTFFKFYHQNGFGKGHEELNELYSGGVYNNKFREHWWNRVTELANKYNPDLYYFDWCWNSRFWEKERPEFLSYYYNQAIRSGKGKFGKPEVVLNYKNAAIQKGCAVYDLERGRMSSATSDIWQTDTSVSDFSWGYSTTDQYKTPKNLITMLTDIVSKNGILMLAFGPKADGSIPDEYRLPMLEIGKWLKANGEAIYSSRPWEVAGEGPVDSNNEKASELYSAKDIRYTQSKDGKYVYATIFGLPHSKLTLLSTRVNEQSAQAKITMLANDKQIPYKVNKKQQIELDLSKITAKNAGCDYAYSFRLEGFELEGEMLSIMDRTETYMYDFKDHNPLPGTFESEYPYLSAIDPIYERAHNGIKRDKNYHGKTIKIGGKEYEHGLMVCPAGEEGLGLFMFGTDKLPKFKGISAEIGIDDAVTNTGACEFIIEAYIKGNWKELYKSKVLRTNDEVVKINVDIPAKSEFIRLITTDGGNGTNADHAVWADLKFTN